MKTVFIEIITPLGSYKSKPGELNSEELKELQDTVIRVTEGDYSWFSITDENNNKHHFPKNILSNSIISIIVNQ